MALTRRTAVGRVERPPARAWERSLDPGVGLNPYYLGFRGRSRLVDAPGGNQAPVGWDRLVCREQVARDVAGRNTDASQHAYSQMGEVLAHARAGREQLYQRHSDLRGPTLIGQGPPGFIRYRRDQGQHRRGAGAGGGSPPGQSIAGLPPVAGAYVLRLKRGRGQGRAHARLNLAGQVRELTREIRERPRRARLHRGLDVAECEAGPKQAGTAAGTVECRRGRDQILQTLLRPGQTRHHRTGQVCSVQQVTHHTFRVGGVPVLAMVGLHYELVPLVASHALVEHPADGQASPAHHEQHLVKTGRGHAGVAQEGEPQVQAVGLLPQLDRYPVAGRAQVLADRHDGRNHRARIFGVRQQERHQLGPALETADLGQLHLEARTKGRKSTGSQRAEQTGHSQRRVGPEGHRVEEVVVDPPVDHVHGGQPLDGAGIHGVVVHHEVPSLHQLDAHRPGQEGVLEVGGVEDAGGEHHHKGVVPTSRRHRLQRGAQHLPVLVGGLDRMVVEQPTAGLGHGRPVLHLIGDAAGVAQVVLEHPVAAVGGPHHVDAGDVAVRSVGDVYAHGAALEAP